MSVDVVRCDVAIVGAGLAGINALFVASRYLSRDQTVVLIDRRKRSGGMWLDTYPYLRLHQPHRLFTAGNIKWTLGEDRPHLANRNEVLGHFDHCLDVIKRRVRVEEFFGWTVDSYDETDQIARITCRSDDAHQMVIEADRLINADGYGVVPNSPLALSSSRVRSVSPDDWDMRGDAMRSSDAPIWVVGGGKTGMDTADALIQEYPGRKVNLVAGSGTWFLNRDRCFPTGARRWTSGRLATSITEEVAMRFDGTNESEVGDWWRTNWGTWSTPAPGSFNGASMSEGESHRIAAGLSEVAMDHVVDVLDRDGATEILFRSGATRTIAPGSWIVNCTGYLFRDRPYEPYASRSGRVISIQPRSATFPLSSWMGFLTTHLLFADKIRDAQLYELDLVDLRQKSKAALWPAMMSLGQHNMSLVMDNVPPKALLDLGFDLDRWFPLPRRMVQTARFMIGHRRKREHHRRTLDTLRERFDVRCGTLLEHDS